MEEYYSKILGCGYPNSYLEPENAEQYAPKVFFEKIETEWELNGIADEHAGDSAPVATEAFTCGSQSTQFCFEYFVNNDDKLAMVQ